MLAAFAASSLFLITYLNPPRQAGSVPFHGAAWPRPIYFGLLAPHIVLAALVVPLALTTTHRAWHGPGGCTRAACLRRRRRRVAPVCLGSALR
jgi:uncharacterized membrane protein YozB (DUF420 family)